MMAGKDAMIEYRKIHKQFGKRKILCDLSIQLKSHQVLLLSGENGSGKSTLLRVMAGLLKPDSGEIIVATDKRPIGQNRKYLLEQVMYLHQTPYMFEGSVKKNLAYALRKRAEADPKLINEALQWVGLTHLANENAKNLSGGERQRIALARALLRRPRILLLDEPTAHLDAASNAQVADLLSELKLRTDSMLIASHEPGHLNDLVDVEYILENGRLISKADQRAISGQQALTNTVES